MPFVRDPTQARGALRRFRSLALLLVALVLAAVGAIFAWLRPTAPPIAAPRARLAAPSPSDGSLNLVPEEAASSARQPIDAESPTLPTTSLTFRFETKRSTLAVALVADGEPARSGTVSIAGVASEDARRWKDIDPTSGVARFEQIPIGAYEVQLRDLPRGWVAPRDRTSDPFSRLVELPETGRTLRIELERGVHLSGTVCLPDGSPVRSRVDVPSPEPRITVWRYDESVDAYTPHEDLAVRNGRFEGNILDGLCVLTVERLAEGGNDAHILPPVPLLRRFAAGSERTLDLVCRAPGDARLAGSALDERGQPFADLRIDLVEIVRLEDPLGGDSVVWDKLGRQLRTRTGREGTFTIDGLRPGRFAVWVEPGNRSPMLAPDKATIGQFDPPSLVDVGVGDARLDLRLRRARPVHVTGKIEVDLQWAAQHVVPGQSATLAVLYSTGVPAQPEQRLHVGSPQTEFAFWLESTLRDPRLELELAGEKLVVPLALAPDVVLDPLTIRFPR